MCGVTPASSLMPSQTTSGGGRTTPAAPINPNALVPVLQQLVAALQALTNALQGAGAVTAGGAMGAPIADAATGAMTKGASPHAGHAPTKGGGGHGAHAEESHHHGMRIIKRETPADLVLAQRNLDSVYSTFRSHTREGLDFRNNSTHGYLTQGERDAYRRQNPGLPVPESLVFREGSNTPIGAVYRSTTAGANMDLGMGDRHDHTGDKGNSQMQHIWFTPDHVDFAFSDVSHGMTGTTAAAIKKLGYPV